jgi:uncharacterized membrane protein YvbJ
MSAKCENCGHEIDGNSPICMYCGAALKESDMNQETRDRIKTEAVDTHRAANASSLKAVGAVLMIIGFLTDIISMVMIVSSSYSAFGVVTAIGTVCFILGLVLFVHG